MADIAAAADPEAGHLGHRERLRRRFLERGADALADYELLELILFGAIRRGDTKPLAKALLARYGSLEGVVTAPSTLLRGEPGVGDAVATALKAVEAAAIRMARGRVVDQPIIGSWEKLVDYCRVRLGFLRHEEFHVLFLDRKNRLIADELQGSGTVDHTPVYPREVVKRALELGASALILVHNHPSGDPTPSDADIDMTRKIERAADSLGISLHDHLIVGGGTYVSLRARGAIR